MRFDAIPPTPNLFRQQEERRSRRVNIATLLVVTYVLQLSTFLPKLISD